MARAVPMTAQFKIAREIVRREMHLYDALAQPARIRYERKVVSAIDNGALTPTFTCGHGILLYEPCDKCTRTVEECKVYLRDAQRRVKELLSILK